MHASCVQFNLRSCCCAGARVCVVWVVQVQPTAHGARNFSQCDSMLIGDTAGANTYPYITVGLSISLLWRPRLAFSAERCCLDSAFQSPRLCRAYAAQNTAWM